MKRWKKAQSLSVFLAIVMAAGSIPMPAAAKETNRQEQQQTNKDGTLDETLYEKLVEDSADLTEESAKYEAEDEVVLIVELNDAGKTLFRSAQSAAENQHDDVKQQIQDLMSGKEKKPFSFMDGKDENDPVFEVLYDYYKVMNGFAVRVQYQYLEQIKELSDVRNVFVENTYEIPDEGTETNAYVNSDSLNMIGAGADGYDGEGTVVAIIDSGLDTDHEAFSGDLEDETVAMTKEDVEKIKSTLNGSGGVYISEKIPFAYDYADNDNEVNPASGLEHGTHVAGIIAANGGDTIRGVAPETQIIPMKVANDVTGSIPDSSIIAALEDAVKLNVDAINMSLGTDAGFPENANETYARVYESVEETGITLNVAAGNAYSAAYMNKSGKNLPYAEDPDSSVIASPATYESTFAVASVDATKDTNYMLDADGNKIRFAATSNVNAPSMGSLEKTLEYVDCGYGHTDEIPASVKGQIALIQRGTDVDGEDFYYSQKVQNAADAGAVAVIIYDNIEQDSLISMTVENNDIPAVFVSNKSGKALLAQETKKVTVSDDYKDAGSSVKVSDFSSWGVSPDLKLKPEIAAPGGSIYSSVLDGQYATMSGTSMATPHMAGLTAAVRQYLEETYPDMDKSEQNDMITTLLMSTAEPAKDGDSYVSPRKQGAGLANLKNAVETPAYISVKDADARTPKADLGESTEGTYQFTFTVHNTSDKELSYKLDTAALSEQIKDGLFQQKSDNYTGKGIDVSYEGAEDGVVKVAKNSTADVTVSIKAGDEFKEMVKAAVNGTFIDGFVMLEAQGDNDIDLTIPFMGFYGDWSQAPIFDATAEKGNAHINGSYAYSASSGAQLGLNVLAGDGVVHYDRFVVSPGGLAPYFTDMATSTGLLRNAQKLQYTLTPKGDPETIVQQKEYDQVYKSYYRQSALSITAAESFMTDPFVFNGYDMDGHEVEDGWYTLTIKGWTLDGDENADDEYSFDVYYDTEKPVLENYEIVGEEGSRKLNVTVSDKHYLGAVELQGMKDGGVSGAIAQAKESETVGYEEKDGRHYYTFSFDFEEIVEKLGNSTSSQNMIYVAAYDYGLNYMQESVAINTVYPSEITLDKSNVSLYKGQEAKLTAAFKPDDATETALTWKSSDTGVAEVSKDGVITAKGAGETTIIVTAQAAEGQEPVSAQCKVTVQAIPDDKGIVMSKEKIDLTEGENTILTASVTDALTGEDIAWESSDPEVLRIEEESSGKVILYAQKAGRATVTATVKKGFNEYKAECSVNVESKDAADFVIDENGVLTSYVGNRVNISIPGNVTAIGDNVFRGTLIEEVRIPESVKSIGDYAFYSCARLTNVVIEGEGLESFGNSSFASCTKLTSVPMPASVTEIKANAFSQTPISSMVIPEGVTELADGVFYGDGSLTKLVLPSKLTKIGNSALYMTGITELNLPDTLEEIGDLALAYSSLQSFTAPDSLRTVGNRGLSGLNCEITLNEGLETLGDMALTESGMTEIVIPDSVTSVGSKICVNCPNLKKAVIGKNVDSLVEPFVGATSLETFEIAKGNKSYMTEDNILYTIDGKTLVTYPLGRIAIDGPSYQINDKVENIADYAFYGAGTLTEIKFGENTKNIGNYAFQATGLTALKDMKNVEVIGNHAFANDSSLKTVEIGDKVKEIGSYAFAYDATMTSVTLGNSVETVGSYAFQACEGITDFSFPDSVTTIGTSALLNCYGLKSISIGKGVTSLDSKVFTGASLLESINVAEGNPVYYSDEGVLYERREDGGLNLMLYLPAKTGDSYEAPKGVKQVEDFAFRNNKNIKKVTFQEGLESLGTSAFNGCTSLAEINLPESLTTIGTYAFMNVAVKDMIIGPNLTEWKNDAFGFASQLERLCITGGKDLSIPSNMLFSGVKSIYIGSGIKSIGNGAFSASNALTTVVIDGDVESIDKNAFSSNADITFHINPKSNAYQMVKDMNIGEVVDYESLQAFLNCSPASVKPGTAPEISASSQGGLGDKQYRFVEVAEDGTETELQAYSESSTLKNWTAPEGNTTIRVYVQDSTLKETSSDLMIGEGYATGTYYAEGSLTEIDSDLLSPLNSMIDNMVQVEITKDTNKAYLTFKEEDSIQSIKYRGEEVIYTENQIDGNRTYELDLPNLLNEIELEIQTDYSESAETVRLTLDMENAKPAANKTALNKALEEWSALNETHYTEETWSAVEKAGQEAQALADAKTVSQEEVNNATKALQKAIEALVRNDLPDYEWPEAGTYLMKAIITKQSSMTEDGLMDSIQNPVKVTVNEDGTYDIYLTFGPSETDGERWNGQAINYIQYRGKADNDWNDYKQQPVEEDTEAGTKTFKITFTDINHNSLMTVFRNDSITGQSIKFNVDTSTVELPIEEDAADKTDLIAAYNAYRNLDLSQFRDGTEKETFEKALAAAKEALADRTMIQDDVNTALEKLEEAKRALVPKADSSALKALLESVSVYKAEDYAKNLWDAFEVAKETAEALAKNENADETAVAEAYDNLMKASLALAYKADTTLLKAEMDSIAKIDLTQYTDASVAALQKLLDEANALLEDKNLTQADQDKVDAMLTRLVQAVNDLEEKVEEPEKQAADKTELFKLVKEAVSMDLSGYTDESIKEFQKVLALAMDMLSNDSLTEDDQTKVDEMITRLNQAIEDLEKAAEPDTPDTPDDPDDSDTLAALQKQLEKLIEQVEQMNTTGYTKGSIRDLEKALAYASDALKNSKNDKTLQKAIDALNYAIENLEKADVQDGNGNQNNGGNDGSNAAKTGDTVPVSGWTFAFMLAAAGLTVVFKRKKEK